MVSRKALESRNNGRLDNEPTELGDAGGSKKCPGGSIAKQYGDVGSDGTKFSKEASNLRKIARPEVLSLSNRRKISRSLIRAKIRDSVDTLDPLRPQVKDIGKEAVTPHYPGFAEHSSQLLTRPAHERCPFLFLIGPPGLTDHSYLRQISFSWLLRGRVLRVLRSLYSAQLQ
jgi:hypothetical protein